VGWESCAHLCMPTRQKVVDSSRPNKTVKVKRTALYCGYLQRQSVCHLEPVRKDESKQEWLRSRTVFAETMLLTQHG